MGFYTPSTIVGDAQRHGIEVRPIDVCHSDWDCTLEPLDQPHGASPGFAIRMGLRYVRGLRRDAGARVVAERQRAPFGSLDDLVRRTQVDEGGQTRLAESGALSAFHANRRDALWQVRGFQRAKSDTLPLPQAATGPDFAPLDELEEVIWDHETSFHSTRGHPLAPLRSVLRAHKLPDARTVHRMRDGQRVHYAGMVICRQRPGTASGVTFMTLEDETGFLNAVLWQRVWELYGPLARTTAFLGISGRLQVEEGLVHLVADTLWRPRLDRDLGPHEPPSRDFR
jgi:error-prone DNA polymerase